MQRSLLVAFVVLVAGTMTAQAYSTGPPQSQVVSQDGCTCHGGGSPSSATTLTVAGVPTTYQPGTKYHINVTSSTTVVNAGENKGGFLAFASKGSFSKRSGSQDWYLTDDLDNGTKAIRHNKNGDTANTASNQPWWFVWTAPAKGSGAVNLRFYVNRVNGINGADTGDAWNRKHFTVKEATTTASPNPPPPQPQPNPPAMPPPGPNPPPPAQGSPGASDPALAPLTVLLVIAVVVASYRRR